MNNTGNMKVWIIALIVVVGVLVGTPMMQFNNLARSFEEVQAKASTIDVQLKRRADLIGNLLETVKGYAAHEAEVIASVSDARARLAGAVTTDEKASANEEVTGALSRLLVISESYPELKADANFRQFSDELAGTENRISVARNDYNAAVSEYNKLIVTFPGNVFAGMYGYERADYFEATEGDTATPKVGFALLLHMPCSV